MPNEDTQTRKKPSTVRITIQSDDCQDAGLGVVIARRPLTILVPRHLVVLVEQGQSQSVLIDDARHDNVQILPAPALQRDDLSVLRFPRTRCRYVSSVPLPKATQELRDGQAIRLLRPNGQADGEGVIREVRDRGDGCSVITDVPVASGDSGSPLMIGAQLAAVCQGMVQQEGSGTAVAVPLSADGLLELRRLRSRYRMSMISALITALLVVTVAFVGFAIYSASSFTLSAIEVPDDGARLTARNAQTPTLRPSWSKTFDTPIRTSLMFSTSSSGDANRIAIGTLCRDGINGQLVVLDSLGRERWRYEIPAGECIYSSDAQTYDGFLPVAVYPADLDLDGEHELLAVFVHDHFYPCKLVVFRSTGEVLAEYWHPGYIRAIAIGQVGEESEPFVVISASNNRIRTDWWNPQTLFAFRGLDISGQAPPYTGTNGSASMLAPANELWYWVIQNVDSEVMRAKCKSFDIVDFNGDQVNEIRAPLTDGRFYYFDEAGNVVSVDLGDSFLKSFPDVAPPPLVEIQEYIDTVVFPFHNQRFAPD